MISQSRMPARAAGAIAAAIAAPVLAGAPAARADGGPHGRVVRIERAQVTAVPRLCAMSFGRDQSVCFGRPTEGERVALVDTARKEVLGVFLIDAVGEPNDLAGRGLCVDSGLYPVKGTFLDDADAARGPIGLRGIKLTARSARVMPNGPPPSGRTDEAVELTLDSNGDGRADLVLTQYECDEAGVPAPGADGRCFDTYTDVGRGPMQRVHRDILRTCH
jgi:hypothetical protein